MHNVAGPSKHSLLELNKRVDGLARQARTLPAETAEALSKEFQVPVDAVQSRFLAQQRVIDGAVSQVEGAGGRSQQLRDHNQGVVVVGLPKTQLGQTPALQGKNLQAPGDAARGFNDVVGGLNWLADRVQRGTLGSPALDVAAQELFQKAPTDGKAIDEQWSPVGATVRHNLMSAQDRLAQLAPDAVVSIAPDGSPRTAQHQSLQFHLNDALLSGDPAEKQKWGSAFVAAFPNDPLTPWAQTLASGKG